MLNLSNQTQFCNVSDANTSIIRQKIVTNHTAALNAVNNKASKTTLVWSLAMSQAIARWMNKKNNSLLKSSDLFCCNCNKVGHTANYKKCEKYTEQVEKRKLQLQNTKKKNEMFNNFVSSGLSFADQIRGNKQTPANNNNKQKPPVNSRHSNGTNSFTNSSFLESEYSNHFGSNMFEMLDKINNFIPLYKKLDAKQKPLKLLEFFIHISDRNGAT